MAATSRSFRGMPLGMPYFDPLVFNKIHSPWNSSDLYIKIATKLVEDGPSEQDVTNIGQHIRRLLELDQPSIAQRYRSAGDATYASANTRSRLDVLCGKLLKYAGFVN